MERSRVQDWLDRYVEAWRANEEASVVALFSDGADYRYRPYGGDDHRAAGITEIVEAWMSEGDDPDSWEATYTVYAVDGDRAVATGTSRYLATDAAPERVYHNCFLLRFAEDGRCAEFTEYYVKEE